MIRRLVLFVILAASPFASAFAQEQTVPEPQATEQTAPAQAGDAQATPAGEEVAPIADPGADATGADTLPAPEAANDAILHPAGVNHQQWLDTATRAETIVQNERGSTFALERLRNELVGWRDQFMLAQSDNSDRVATVQSQLDIIGPKPADGAPPENQAITDRRSELQTQLADLRAPAILANEAYAQANGLIGEIDRLLRSQQAQMILSRGPSPLNPAAWPDVMQGVSTRLVGGSKELMTSLRSEVRRETLYANWPSVVFNFLVASILLLRGKAWINTVDEVVRQRMSEGEEVWEFFISLTRILVPLLGLAGIAAGLNATGLFGYRATRMIDTLPLAGLYVLSARWMARRFFDLDRKNPAPFDFSDGMKQVARGLVMRMGWVLAVAAFFATFINTGDVDPIVRNIVLLPFEIAAGVILFRFGRNLVRQPAAHVVSSVQTDALHLGRRLIMLGGRLAMAAAVAAPVLSLIGFSLAGRAILYPAIMTLVLIGLVLLLQWLVYDIYELIVRNKDSRNEALVPVLISLVLALIALPILSLIWGARVEDLLELWTRFRGGYTFGETRISPEDFVTFAIIFAVGYALTRGIQGMLRTSVLPKTKLDIGGQNAIVSGLGYVGIFLSALLAITSTGLDLSNLAIVAGALSVGIGFGLQNIVSNFVSGIILLIERPISEGDWIEVGGRMGYVRDISVRSTRIETFDRTDVIVPNADLVSGQVVNWTRGNSVGRVIVPVSVAFGADVDKVHAILQEVAEAHPLVLMQPPPSIVLAGFGADALNYEIRAIIRDVNFGLSVRSEMNHTIARRFFDEGIELAGAARANATPGRTALTPATPVAPASDDDGSKEVIPT
ncbi:MAG: DUF3772 domain-containing protein [Rhodobacterales bacterium]|nr:DUF3772 domain-containing protein [Rhodobacterales bacterium]